MAYWLKAAEDLFEGVDRRVKLVAGEKSDEQLNIQAPASNGRGSQAKRASKPRKKLSSSVSPVAVDIEKEKAKTEIRESEVLSEKEASIPVSESNSIGLCSLSDQSVNDMQQTGDGDASNLDASSSAIIPHEEVENVDHIEVAESEQSEGMASWSHEEKTVVGTSDAEVQSSPATKDADDVLSGPPVESNQSKPLGDKIPSDHEKSHIVSVDELSKTDSQLKDVDIKPEPVSGEEKDPEPLKADLGLDHKKDKKYSTTVSALKVQEQLNEAQGLLKSAVSTGQSKEARLARVCAGLSSRLQEYKSENAQLEELLFAERELSKSYEDRIKELQKDLSVSKSEVSRVESSMADALSAKNAEIEALMNSLDAMKKQAALSEGNLASLQENMETIMRNRELTETRMMQALREELAAAERRAEEERAAHNATKMAAMEREVDLEHRAIEASTALARTQRTADERTAKASDLEQKIVLLEAECASLNQELQDMEARARRGQKKSPEEANQAIQAWQEEVERARQSQRDAESKLSSMEAEVQKMRVDMAAMKRDAEHYSRQEHMELEKRYRELTDLLYYKQTQLETMASEKAAAEFQLEKELKRLQEVQAEAEKGKVSRRASSSWEEDTEIKALETLPLYQRHMVGASMQLQKAAKLLDTGAVRATRFLWRYPTARVLLLFYLVFVHLFLMYLLHRLQEQADTYTSRELAESMGLANGTLP